MSKDTAIRGMLKKYACVDSNGRKFTIMTDTQIDDFDKFVVCQNAQRAAYGRAPIVSIKECSL